MGKTTFSGPVLAGSINETTGSTLGSNVKNTGYVTMAQGKDVAITGATANTNIAVIPANSQILFVHVDVTEVSNDTNAATFSVGNGGEVNGSGDGMIAYCFAEKKGFSKFGKYTGNGEANGSFAYTGFKPAFLLLKQSSGSQGWFLVDNKRANPFNPVDGSLHPNANAAEDTSSDFFVDFTSNGFKLRDSDSQLNGSGSDYIYMSFSEEPLVASNDNPATAR